MKLANVKILIVQIVIAGAFASNAYSVELAQTIPGKPKYGTAATRLHDHHQFIVKKTAPDYWALSPYYVPQEQGNYCIIASFAMTLNAMRANQKLGAADSLISQAEVLKKIGEEPAAKRFYVDKGKSISLIEMAELFKKAAYELLHKKVEVDYVHADVSDPGFEKKLEKILVQNEKSDHDFVLANFLQSEYTGDPEGAVGHVAPVAAYDVAKKMVLIMDPDREYYEPYWVSLTTFIKGLNTLDKDAGKNRGILYIHE